MDKSCEKLRAIVLEQLQCPVYNVINNELLIKPLFSYFEQNAQITSVEQLNSCDLFE